jgi:NCAIR mutase (PurE)-related protein
VNEATLRVLLEQVHSGALAVDGAVEQLRDLPFRDLGEAMLDNHRELRRGHPEVVYCAGKTCIPPPAITPWDARWSFSAMRHH